MNLIVSESSRSVIYKEPSSPNGEFLICKICSNAKSSKSELLNEYQITRTLTLEGIRKPVKTGIYNNKEAIFYQYFDGVTLKELISKNQVTLQQFFEIALQIVHTLVELHKEGITHHRINSNNILYSSTTGKTQLIDFSLAVKKGTNKAPDFKEWGAELAYMAPEQTGHLSKTTDNRTDLYSLGIVLYELWSGKTPFQELEIAEIIHHHLVNIPKSLSSQRTNTPESIDLIIEKLLRKSPDARYQTASGLWYDLEYCYESLIQTGSLPILTPGLKDIPDKISLSQYFYGREPELEQLSEGLKAVKEGNSELYIVTGETGIGKTRLIQHFQQEITANGGVFLYGKFGRQNLHLPNRALIQAFKGLAAFVLSQSDQKLQEWKELLQRAVDDIGQLLIEIIPEYEWIIGVQQPIPELSANQLESRLNFLFTRLIEEIATPEHPLVLCIDDIHLADSASWKSFQNLFGGNKIAHFMMICTCRMQEIEEQPVQSKQFELLSASKPELVQIYLKNLDESQILKLINDSFVTENAALLSHIVFTKTRGNAFFIHKFLQSLLQRGLLFFMPETASWKWDQEKTAAIQMADNVVAYMNEKVKSLPSNVLRTLMVASCIGNTARVNMLCELLGIAKEDVEKDLEFYVAENLLEKEQYDEYRFVHDRIQQTSHELLPEDEKSLIHYRIAGLLAGEQNYADDAKQMFNIASNYNQGFKYIKPEERLKVAKLNYEVGLEAKKTAAFELAYKYLEAALLLMQESDWENEYELMLHIHNEASECGMIAGNQEKSNALLNQSLKHAKSFNDRIKAHEIKINHLSETHQFPETVAHLLEVLDEIGYGIKRNPSKISILREFIKVKVQFLGKKIDDIPNLPPMEDERAKAFIKLTVVAGVSIFGHAPDILPIVYFRQTYLSLKYGNSEDSPYSYCFYGFAITVFMGDVKNGHAMARMALKLVEKDKGILIKSKVMVVYYAFLSYWKDSLVESIAPLKEAYYVGRQTGDLLYASFAASFYNHVRMFTGDNLSEVLESMTEDCITIKSLKQDLVYIISECQRQYVLNLINIVDEPWVLKHEGFDEVAYMHQLDVLGDTASKFDVYFYKLALSIIFNEYAIGFESSELARKYEEETTARQIPYPTFLLFSAMAGLKNMDQKTPQEKSKIKKNVAKKLALLRSFSKYAPQNYENKCCFLEAMLFEQEGKKADAGSKYQEAINLSVSSGFVNEEAIIREHFSYFLDSSGQKEFAAVMLHKSYECYSKWGANNKCHQLLQRFPELREHFQDSNQENTIAGLQNIFDLNTIIKSNQILSSENNLEGLLRKMVALVIANASTSKVVILIKSKDQQLLPYAIGTHEQIKILSEEEQQLKEFPNSIIQFVMHSHTEFVSPNLKQDKRYNFDPYVKAHATLSVCCIPLLTKDSFLGALYFENNLTEFAFDKKRVEFFKTIGAQLAISLDNVILYDEMEQKVKDRTSELLEKNRELTNEKKKSDDLLLNILPAAIAEELKDHGKTTARRYENVTILFSDIKNFTQISEILSPEELVSELDICFKKFDEIIIANGLEKIKTVGDAYIAVGGLPDGNIANALNVVNAALQMQDFIVTHAEKRRSEGFPYFAMRLGINTGPVVAGVVGIKKFQFDIWGDAVNVAARMEQHSETGKVNLSKSTYELVKNEYRCEYRGKIHAKNLGDTDMYFVYRD